MISPQIVEEFTFPSRCSSHIANSHIQPDEENSMKMESEDHLQRQERQNVFWIGDADSNRRHHLKQSTESYGFYISLTYYHPSLISKAVSLFEQHFFTAWLEFD